MNTLIKSLTEKKKSCLPIWFMRQAGRYLPEFRKIRSENPDFIKLCLNSSLSSKITLQPLERFDLDAAIIFSDILMVPYALGQEVNFIAGIGPKLSDFKIKAFLEQDKEKFNNDLFPVYLAIKKTKERLKSNKSLISFIGSPWTLIVYMLGLKNSTNVLNLDLIKKKQKEIDLILKNLIDFLCNHIKNQIKAGADIVQIFDSWAGLIPQDKLEKYCFEPNLKIVNFCKENKIPVICFPKGIKEKYYDFLQIVKPDGLSIDYSLDPEWARKNLENVCVQGGMDPRHLLKDDSFMINEVERYLKIFKDTPYIFNLGHGLLPETNPDKVKKIVEFVRNYK